MKQGDLMTETDIRVTQKNKDHSRFFTGLLPSRSKFGLPGGSRKAGTREIGFSAGTCYARQTVPLDHFYS